MNDLILAIDLGTTALKVAVFDFEGRLLADSNQEYELLTPYMNWVEADVEIYFQALGRGLADLSSQGQDLASITAIGYSAQGETMFFLDENGRALRNAIVWMDNRASEEADMLREKFGDELCYQITGQVSFEPCWPASKILWVKRNEPEVFRRTKKILLIEDYLIYRMTGRFVSEGSLLTSTEYWDINTKKYWPEMLETLGISEEQLPEIRESGEVVGKLLPEAAKELGLNPAAVVCTGCLDQAAGAIGVGNIREGVFSENIGAALAVCVPVKENVRDPKRVVPVHYFALQDTYMLHTFTTGGMALRWFRDVFCELEIGAAKLLDESSYELLSMEAGLAPPGSEGLLMLPHLNGSMPPDMNANAKGVFYGFSLKHSKRHFIRSIMESIGYIVMRNIEALQDMGVEVKEIRSLGGGARSSVWNQIKADITGRTLHTMACKEAACLGAAILAGKAVGAFPSIEEACTRMVRIEKSYEPNSDHTEVYEAAFGQFKNLFSELHRMFDSGQA